MVQFSKFPESTGEELMTSAEVYRFLIQFEVSMTPSNSFIVYLEARSLSI